MHTLSPSLPTFNDLYREIAGLRPGESIEEMRREHEEVCVFSLKKKVETVKVDQRFKAGVRP